MKCIVSEGGQDYPILSTRYLPSLVNYYSRRNVVPLRKSDKERTVWINGTTHPPLLSFNYHYIGMKKGRILFMTVKGWNCGAGFMWEKAVQDVFPTVMVMVGGGQQ